MMYLNPIPYEDGSYAPPQSSKANGLLAFPDEFMSTFYMEGKEVAGFVTIEDDGTTVTSCEWNEEAYQDYINNLPSTEKTPSEKREEAYNNEAIISWEDKMITVTQAAQLWQYYAAEGSPKAEELTTLIAEAKQKIREMYPDESV